MVALAAPLLAVAIGATLFFAARSLHSTSVVPADPVVPANPVPLPKSGNLLPGTYFLANPNVDANRNCVRACSAYHRIIFTLPAGWTTKDGLVSKHLGQPGNLAFSAWSVRDVFADPCHWQQSVLSPIDSAHSSYNAATGALIVAPYNGGLANQALRGPLPRALTLVTLASVWGGVSERVTALRIDLSVPANLNISTCDKGEFQSWPVAYNGTEIATADLLPDAGADSYFASGQLDTVYIVNVDRWPLVIDASHVPGSSEADLAELKAILASMIIDRG
jgi:hypothetical protein